VGLVVHGDVFFSRKNLERESCAMSTSLSVRTRIGRTWKLLQLSTVKIAPGLMSRDKSEFWKGLLFEKIAPICDL